jgi:hypothetical protein
MTNMDPPDRMESIASGVEQFGSLIPTASDALAEAERRGQAEASGSAPTHDPLGERIVRRLSALLGRR